MRAIYKIIIVFVILSIIVISGFLILWYYGEKGLCEEAITIRGSEKNQTIIIQKIVEWENENILNIYGNLTKGNFLEETFYRLKCKEFAYPWWVYIFRCGACGEYTELYVKMANCINMTSRSIHNYDRDHSWAESLINGTWFHVDPSLKIYNNPYYYENVWNENFSSLYAVYQNGTIEDVTNRYTETGKMMVFVTDGFKGLDNVKITIKTGYKNIINKTDSSGIFSTNLGDKNYTVIAESGFLFGLKEEKKIQIKENSELLLKLQLDFPNKISFLFSDEVDLLNFYIVIFVILMASLTILFIKIIKEGFDEKEKITLKSNFFYILNMVKRRKFYNSVKIEIKQENNILQRFNKFLLEKLKYYYLVDVFWAFIVAVSVVIVIYLLPFFNITENVNLYVPIIGVFIPLNSVIFVIYSLIALFPVRKFFNYNLYPFIISKKLEEISEIEIRSFKDKLKIVKKLQQMNNYEIESTNKAKNQVLDFSFNVLRIFRELVIHVDRTETFNSIKSDIKFLSESFKEYDYRAINLHTMNLWKRIENDQELVSYENYREYRTKSIKLKQTLTQTIMIAIATTIIGIIIELILS